MRTWIDVAQLTGTKRLKGGFVARRAADLPFLLEEGTEVALVPPVLDAPRRLAVTSIMMRNEDEAVVHFDGVHDADTAERLLGSHCLVRRSSIECKLKDAHSDLPDWIGWRVFDSSRGYIGDLELIEDRPLQPLLVVNGAEGRIYIPLAEDLVDCVDEDARRIDLQCPTGLFDL